jgi:hypothetical protein
MGLDMSLKIIPRDIYKSIPKEDFWYDEFEASEQIFYWRKEYYLHNWFYENFEIKEECSEEINKNKINELLKYLIENNFKEDADKLKKIIEDNDFKKKVIYYKFTN